MTEAEIRFRMPEGVDIGARPARTPTAPDLFERVCPPAWPRRRRALAKEGVAPRAEPCARRAIRARVPIALASTSAAWIPRGPLGEPRDIPRPDVAAPRGAPTSDPALGMFDARSKLHTLKRQILTPTRSRPRPLARQVRSTSRSAPRSTRSRSSSSRSGPRTRWASPRPTTRAKFASSTTARSWSPARRSPIAKSRWGRW
mmetsp:Transcript_5096/g.19178  ORF Transcript_5096/g.19178 Transcript_5096/m.19178 type:complete len:201 (-) Transcript_5096:251-853(-)